MSAIQIEELNEIKKVWKPSSSDDRPPRLKHYYYLLSYFQIQLNVSRGGFNYILPLILKDPIK